jgi:two-component system response regulator AlgR
MPITNEITVLIADDEAPARNRLRELLDQIPTVRVLGEAKNGVELVNLAAEISPLLILLDIHMPKMNGIEAARHLQTLADPPAIIFTTAYDSYAAKAFEINALDYLLKPIRLERLQTAINKASKLSRIQLAALQPLQQTRSHFNVLEHGRMLLIPVSEVIYLRAEQKYLTLRTKAREYLIEDSLTAIEQEFDQHFLRLHRNCLVAQEFITGYERCHDNHGDHHYVALLRDVPETIAVSRRQQHLLKERLRG